MSMINPTFSRSRKGRCYSNRFVARIVKIGKKVRLIMLILMRTYIQDRYA